jgi:hypothetical protein
MRLAAFSVDLPYQMMTAAPKALAREAPDSS